MRGINASRTAYLIAESAVYLSFDQKYESLFPNRYLELSRKFAESRPLRKKLLFYANHFSLFRYLYLYIQEKAVPGIRQHYLVRKRRIEDLVRDKINQGFTQIVILGAGFDTLALRLAAEFPLLTFIEVDHASTQNEKIRTIASDCLENTNLHFIPADLANTDISAQLKNNPAYQPAKETIFVAEGLLMYLNEENVIALFDLVRRASTATSAFIFTVMERPENGKIRFQGASRLVDWWLQFYGEPFKWGLPTDQLTTFISSRGFRLESLDDSFCLKERYMYDPMLGKEPLARGEMVCLGIKDNRE